MSEKISNNSNWMVQFNYESSQEFYASEEINTVIDGNTDLDGNWSTDDTYLQYDMGNTLQETKDFGKINSKTYSLVGKIVIGASAALITASAVLEVIELYTPSITGLYGSEGLICRVDTSSSPNVLTYSFEVSYRLKTTLHVYIDVGGEVQDDTYTLETSTDVEGVTSSGADYYCSINNEANPYYLPLDYEGLYVVSIYGDFGFGSTSLSSYVGSIYNE